MMPAMLDYYETRRYVFTHGWVPCIQTANGAYRLYPDWRGAGKKAWKQARWINGMDAAQTAAVPGKTVVCGHCPASYGHATMEKKGSMLGSDADFSPYYGTGVIAVDACTAISGRINVLVFEDEVTI